MVKPREKVDKQAEIIASQQNFLEVLDRKERETKLVILGAPDEGEILEGETSDQGKLQKVWSQAEEIPEVKSYKKLVEMGTV